MKKSIIVACITGALHTGVIAEQQADFEAYLGASHYFWDSERNLDDATGFDLGAELPVTEALSFEAWLSGVDADVENSSAELEGERYSLGGLYHFADTQETLRPFMTLGVSHLEFETPSNATHDEALAYLGAGVKKYFDNNLILRAELMGMNSLDNEVTDMAARLAIGYAFGRTASSAESTTAKRTTPVAAPAPAPVVETPPAPQPKAEKPVVVAPAPVDSDGDGVVDERDQCANTNPSYRVDESGCPVMETETVSIALNVNFPSNSDEIPAASLPEIKRVADFMQQFPNASVTVEGHTDDRGRAAYNKALSQKRADAVRLSLINDFDIASERVEAMGYGEEKPIADNNTAAGRAENRRVVAVVKAQAEKPVAK